MNTLIKITNVEGTDLPRHFLDMVVEAKPYPYYPDWYEFRADDGYRFIHKNNIAIVGDREPDVIDERAVLGKRVTFHYKPSQ